MLLSDPVAVGALVLVEDVRRELAALVLPHLAAVEVVVDVVEGLARVIAFQKRRFRTSALISNRGCCRF